MKQPNRYKLTPDVYKQLLKISGELPQLQKLSKSGNPLYRENPVFVGTNLTKEAAVNRRGYKNHIQRQQEPVLINHMVELVDKYQQFGMAKVNEYVAQVHRIVESSRVEEPALPTE